VRLLEIDVIAALISPPPRPSRTMTNRRALARSLTSNGPDLWVRVYASTGGGEPSSTDALGEQNPHVANLAS
jgi:hypothetical protein